MTRVLTRVVTGHEESSGYSRLGFGASRVITVVVKCVGFVFVSFDPIWKSWGWSVGREDAGRDQK